jgi:hypothetical protein
VSNLKSFTARVKPSPALAAERREERVKVQIRLSPDAYEKLRIRVAKMRPRGTIQDYLEGLLRADGIA